MNLNKNNIGDFYRNNFSKLIEYSKTLGNDGFSEDAVQDDFLWALEMIKGSSSGIDDKAVMNHMKLENIKYSGIENNFCCSEDLTYLVDTDF